MLLYFLVFDPNQFLKYCFSLFLFTFYFFFEYSLQQKKKNRGGNCENSIKKKSGKALI